MCAQSVPRTKQIKELKKQARKEKSFSSYTTLAQAYYSVHNYDSSFYYFDKASLIDNSSSIAIKKAKCLIANNKTNEALAVLQPFSSEASVKKEIAFMHTDKSKFNYILKPVNTLNTDFNEFPCYIEDNTLVLTTDRSESNFSLSKDPIGDNPPYALYKAYAAGKENGVTTFSRLNAFPFYINKNGATGAATFNRLTGMFFYTKSTYSSINRKAQISKLYIQYKNKKPKPFIYNSDQYNTQHPTLSVDGRVLIFSSDKPGGYGKFDLYICELKDDNTWTVPKNMGANINSEGNEVFPFIAKNGSLYYSSDGLPGYGGLDLFSYPSLIDTTKLSENLGKSINSSYDEFSICFNDSLNSGYVATDKPYTQNRGDNIFYFRKIKNTKTMSGRISEQLSLQNGGVSGLQLILLTKKGEQVRKGKTDAHGFFVFNELEADENYLIKIESNDPSVLKRKLYLYSDNDKVVSTSVINANGDVFFFQELPPDLTALQELQINDAQLVNFSATIVADKNGKKIPASNKRITIVNANGNIIRTTITNVFGSFVFTEIDAINSLTAYLEDDDPTLNKKSKYYMVNNRGEIIKTNFKNENQRVYFSIDASTLKGKNNTVEKTNLKKNLKGVLKGMENGKPELLSNVVVNMLDGSGSIIKSVITNMKGAFEFVGLPFDSTYFLNIQSDDPALKKYSVFNIEDEQGNRVIEMNRDKLKSFGYKIFKTDEEKLAFYFYEDPWLNVISKNKKSNNITITENILYQLNSAEISEDAKIVLDKVVQVLNNNKDITIEVGAHTDSRAGNDFNLTLSQKRAQKVVDYLYEHGIDKKRMIPVGYGETQLKNHCKDGVPCTEEEHAINRRTEFKVFSK
ncbi:MAG: OmpA family protein [Bacteroidia bacterium]|nr:OmpA family protein [Bacteroidia bacterium]